SDEVFFLLTVEFTFQSSDGGKLGVGENDVQQERIIDGVKLFHAGGVAGGEFALLNRQVHDLGGTGAVAGGVDGRGGGLLPFVDDDLARDACLDACGGEVERGGVGFATQRVEEVRRAAGGDFSGAEKLHADTAGVV